MIEVRNLLFQPLTFHVAGGESLHLGPRQRRAIENDHVSLELEQAARRGYIRLTEQTDAAAEPEAAATTHVIKRARKGRN